MKKLIALILILMTFNVVTAQNIIKKPVVKSTNTQNVKSVAKKPAINNSKTTMKSMVKTIGVHNGHDYVDLGLSVKWATCNVGANSPTEAGDLYAWGETKVTSDSDWKNYKFCNPETDKLSKYCTEADKGIVDNKMTLEPVDDVANVEWGGNWRMPTVKEFRELKEKCQWKWTEQNGVKGCLVISNKNGNSIFIPFAGYKGNNAARYSTSSLYNDNPNMRYNLQISTFISTTPETRVAKTPIRPVFQ